MSLAGWGKATLGTVCGALLLVGIGTGGTQAAQSAASPPTPLPPGCSLTQVRSTFDGLFRAANSASVEGVGRYVAPSGELNSFSISDQPDPESPRSTRLLLSANPGKVSSFFARRGDAGYRMQLLQALVDPIERPGALGGPWERPESGPAADDPVVAISIAAKLSRRGLSAKQAGAKVGLNCTTHQFFNWQMYFAAPVELRLCGDKPSVDAGEPAPRRALMCRTPY